MEDKTFELIEKMYNEFSKKFDDIDKRFDDIDKRFEGIDKRFEGIDKRFEGIDKRFEGIDKRFDRLEGEVRKTNAIIEHDIMPKITVLFDGHKQHTAQLERIEMAVSEHEELIIRKIK
ncbi:MAG: hypothetical protein GX925_00975 [Clostridiales bacterium]|mgnify:CR=1 FL=1|nr:hypothetical protein [Clostridiales bacterium]